MCGNSRETKRGVHVVVESILTTQRERLADYRGKDHSGEAARIRAKGNPLLKVCVSASCSFSATGAVVDKRKTGTVGTLRPTKF